MTRAELVDVLRTLNIEYFIKTENTYSSKDRGNNLITVRFWTEEKNND